MVQPNTVSKIIIIVPPPTYKNVLDIHMSVHRNIIPNYSQQDATFLPDLFISTDALHVSGGSSAHHQEHITVHTPSGIVNQYCCYRGDLLHGSS